jgi:hypothetical protein
MTKCRAVKVDESLIDVFGKIGKSFADKIKKDYNLEELFVPDTLASKILAGRYRGQKMFKFKVKKTGLTKGILELED